ncbi:MAG: exonuclease SbcCD subunit D C-terminal domain-containing protein [Deltaproteobacteria bacterium]|nr:exonuclease SbcCD subunit D C-terminal domain-containing protein [Deltaproteobacteria bacterium]
MKLLHTSDWHLGRTLYGKKRYREFDLFLNWLLDTIAENQIDVLIIAGDVFDTTTPGNRAQQQYYRFLLDARDAGCRHIVVIAGNHDSPSFLDAPKPLLQSMHVHVVGTMPESIEDEVVVIRDVTGAPELVICAVPHLRDRDLRRAETGESEEMRQRNATEGLAAHYNDVLIAAQKIAAQKAAGTRTSVPIVATGHLFTAGARCIDGDGVRDLYVGTLAHLNASAFSDRFDYVALGHLHVPQIAGGRPNVRYSGSPLPMGFGEATQQKEVVEAKWQNGAITLTAIPIPCFQRLARVKGDMPAIDAQLRQLATTGESIWLEVDYTGDALIPDLKKQISTMVENTPLEVLRIHNARVFNQVLRSVEKSEDLAELDVTDVFRRLLQAAKIPAEQHDELLCCHDEIRRLFHEADRKAE